MWIIPSICSWIPLWFQSRFEYNPQPYPGIHTPAIWCLTTVRPVLLVPFSLRAFLLLLQLTQLLHALGTLLPSLTATLALLLLSLGICSTISCSERTSLTTLPLSSLFYLYHCFFPYHVSPWDVILCTNLLALFVFTQRMEVQWGLNLCQSYSMKYHSI